MNYPSFAILLAAYNGMKFIEEQVLSILQQNKVDVYLFISVDESSDQTLAWCEDLSLRNFRVTVLPPCKRLGGAANNFFRLISDVDFSSFDYLALADQDDIWLPEKLFRAHTVLLGTGANAYSSNVVAFWPDGRRALIEKSQDQVRWDFLFEAAGPGCTYVMQNGLACAIKMVVKNNFFDIHRVGLHDWFFYAFARANGYRWVIDDYAGMLYRQHEKNQVGVNLGWQALLHRARKIFSGWGLAQSALIAELVGLGDDPFVKRWSGGSRAGLLWLAFDAWQCRRRLRDKILFSLSCIALCLVGCRRP